jgi:large subunit ribosomal protein L10
MPLSRVEKQQLVERYGKGLASAQHAILVDFKGVSVPEVTELRSRLRESGGHYEVVKNRLALLAIQGTALQGLQSHFEGPTAVAYCEEDPVGLAKALTEFAKTVPTIEFKAGLLEGQEVSAEGIKELASLPGRQELITKLVFLLQSPITRLARGLAAIPQQLVIVLDQVRSKHEGEN